MQTWQLQEARNRFNKVIDNAQHDGPQFITKHGEEVAVVLSAEEYHKLVGARKKLSDFFKESPLVDSGLDLSRDKSPIRPDSVL
jgi:antitoxin Phd